MHTDLKTPRRALEDMSETDFIREDIPDVKWDKLRGVAEDFASNLKLTDAVYDERLENGDRWYPYVLVTSPQMHLRVCGWNDMVETMAPDADEWETVVPPQHDGARWHGGGSTFYYPDGTFKFQTHGSKERKGSEDYPVIEDLGSDAARRLFPERYVVLPDGREGISTEGLSSADLKVIMRETGHRIADRGERFSTKNLGDWSDKIARKLRDKGFDKDADQWERREKGTLGW